MKLMRLLPAIAVVLSLGGPAMATPLEDLEAARNAFRDGDFAASIPPLAKLLYPQARLAESSDLAEAHLLLGVAYFETGDTDAAKVEFEAALLLDSSLSIAPPLYSEKVVRFFNGRKKEYEDRIRQDEEERRKAELNQRLKAALKSQVIIERQEILPMFIPFGVGQFRNGDTNKGWLFLGTQAFTAGVSLTTFVYLASKYDWPADGSVPSGEARQVRNLQILQAGSGIAFLGLAAWGIIDAVANFQPEQRLEADPKLLPPELRKLYRKQERDNGESARRMIITPLLGRSNIGAAAAWEF